VSTRRRNIQNKLTLCHNLCPLPKHNLTSPALVLGRGQAGRDQVCLAQDKQRRGGHRRRHGGGDSEAPSMILGGGEEGRRGGGKEGMGGAAVRSLVLLI
jgi:hypothetical protein